MQFGHLNVAYSYGADFVLLSFQIVKMFIGDAVAGN